MPSAAATGLYFLEAQYQNQELANIIKAIIINRKPNVLGGMSRLIEREPVLLST